MYRKYELTAKLESNKEIYTYQAYLDHDNDHTVALDTYVQLVAVFKIT